MSENTQNKNDGGPAFPCPHPSAPEVGMTLRDYFAAKEQLSDFDGPDELMAQSMAEALAGEPRPEHGWSTSEPDEILAMLRWEAKWRAALKLIRADAMIERRKQ